MAFEPGHKKTGGRKKGTPNKKSQHLKCQLESLKFDPVMKLVEVIPGLPPDKQATILVQLLLFLYPRRKAVEESENSANNATLIFVDKEDMRL